MKIALFSDIHANLPAFEAMLKDMDNRKPDAVFCLGDLVGYNIWPNEIIAEIRKRGIATLTGNHDLKVQGLDDANLDTSGLKYAYHIVHPKHIEYLGTLPAHIRLDYQNLNILMVHGSPRKVDEYVLENMDEALVLEMMQQAGADVLCGGHSHKPYQRIISCEDGRHRHVINAGSVGKPKDGDARGCYVMLTLGNRSHRSQKDSILVEFIRFDYDIEAAATAIEDSPLPNELADMLRRAY
ncbi:metallophosphoesterase family protein [Mucilaginibacter paludis]|uniref:Metallophosphoesterase n=1 Tax=Mucilaginibacter paludis DSM 18603 TaxID=714943 RepID=H1YFK0_9SPHI|nr:metallophosphoesterase family protein [Mucilaginibacter paludis]EHQ24402.1 metallophosphoesterase [Mucilaginibacter paludis DSM 18603]